MMVRDLRDPKALGMVLLFCQSAEPHGPSLSVVADNLRHPVVDYDDNPSCIEKYGRPQDLPPTPF